MLTPATPDQLAAALRETAEANRAMRLGGAFSKDRLAGEPAPAEAILSCRCLHRVLEYDPRDLTISVEAGLPWRELCRITAEHRQMVALDPPYFEQATVGGVVAANQSGPRRRLYGSARDNVIGMTFATLEGKLVQTGGKVVKNVAGLDMAKLLIGSWGTLAAITSVNFKLAPMPAETRSFVRVYTDATAAVAERDRILKSALQPAALDLLNPAAARRAGLDGYALLVQAGGNPAMLQRYARELPGFESRDAEAESALWQAVREFTPQYLAEHPQGGVRRVAVALSDIGAVLQSADPVVARAGSGVCYLHHPSESRPAAPAPPGFDLMKRIKTLFDPHHLLNKGRLYGHL
jgi:glycolate oxidase FAD binding subunit